MENSKLIEALDMVLADYQGSLDKMSFILLKEDLTDNEKIIIEKFSNKINYCMEKVSNLYQQILDFNGPVDDSVGPVLLVLMAEAKTFHKKALNAIHSFYPD